MKKRFSNLLLALLALTFFVPRAQADYDPLQRAAKVPVRHDEFVRDETRKREIPIRVFLPTSPDAAPVVLFSPGLGGGLNAASYVGEHWAARGFAVVFLQHPGSDSAVWKNQSRSQIQARMQLAANAQNFMLRAEDVKAVLDQLAIWSAAPSHFLNGRLDLTRIGMSGHSFGAVTTQAVSGQNFPGGQSLTDARIKAAVLMSPSPPRRGTVQHAFGSVKLPWMLLTGTKDEAPVGGTDVISRLSVFPALPAGDKYELMLDGAEHSAFTDTRVFDAREKRNPNHHRAILALTTAFWDAYLNENSDAKVWLASAEVRSVLEPRDRWQKK